jgi:hypothetical protein
VGDVGAERLAGELATRRAGLEGELDDGILGAAGEEMDEALEIACDFAILRTGSLFDDIEGAEAGPRKPSRSSPRWVRRMIQAEKTRTREMERMYETATENVTDNATSMKS